MTAPPRSAATPALVAAVGCGAVVALQSRVNGELRLALDDALLTACVSFVIGLVAVAAVVLTRGDAWQALANLSRVPWWARLGGLGGAVLVAVAAAAAPVVGVALLTVGLVAGQTVGGVLVDRVGLGPGGIRLLTAPRAAGALLCLLAVVLAASGRSVRTEQPLLLLGVLGAGLLIAVQQALNGRVRAATGSAAVATLLNFTVGTAALLAAFAVHAAAVGLPRSDWPGPGSWWLYTGGLMGAVFVAVAAAVVRELGVLRLSLAIVAGQVLGALALDLVLPLADTKVTVATVLGAALTLLAAAVSGRGAR